LDDEELLASVAGAEDADAGLDDLDADTDETATGGAAGLGSIARYGDFFEKTDMEKLEYVSNLIVTHLHNY
jgi:hypothetical protein